MGAFKTWLKRAAAEAAVALFQRPAPARLADWLAWQRRRARRRTVEARLRAAGQYGDEVQAGPFRGLCYTAGWADSRFEKIIGAYEAELHPLIEKLCAIPYTDIVNIGCAEGYYAVGLARRIPAACVHAFELDAARRDHCRELAQLNGVADRLTLAGRCDIAALQQLACGPRVLVVCDCEGAERELLDPALVPWMKQADLLVEVHDFKDPEISPTLRRRFAESHELTVIPTAGLNYSQYPVLRPLSFPEIHAMVGEERAALMEWFFLRARPAAATG